MAEPVTINLWELITHAEDNRYHPKREQCKALTALAGQGSFAHMQEISLRVSESAWTVKLFSADEDHSEVTLTVTNMRQVTVQKIESGKGFHSKREINFN